MLGFLRSSSSATRQVVLLAPDAASVPTSFEYQRTEPRRYASHLRDLQRLRGSIYLRDGAIQPWQVTPDGRHQQEADGNSWHVLVLDEKGIVAGCARYAAHSTFTRFHQLGVSDAPLSNDPVWGDWYRRAVEGHLCAARTQNLGYVEVGGWALSEELRCSTAALQLALASYALAEILGGALSIGTVTHRHASASILRRIGGQPLSFEGVESPTYWDARYGCDMEILTFDSRRPNPKYAGMIQQLTEDLLTAPVLTPNTVMIPAEAAALTAPALLPIQPLPAFAAAS